MNGTGTISGTGDRRKNGEMGSKNSKSRYEESEEA